MDQYTYIEHYTETTPIVKNNDVMGNGKDTDNEIRRINPNYSKGIDNYIRRINPNYRNADGYGDHR